MKIYLNAFFALIAMFAVVGCSNDDPGVDNPNNNPPATEEKEPTVKITIQEVTDSTISFSLDATDAKSVTWLLVKGNVAPDADRVYAEGVETDDEIITCSKLLPETEYTLAVVAVNVEKRAYDTTTVTTKEMPMPEVTVSLREGSVAEKSFSFFISSAEADVLKWVCIEDGSRDVTAAQVIANGTAVEPNVESEVVVENLESDTAYAIYAAATCDIEGFEPVISEKLVIKTAEPEPVGYIFSETTSVTASKTTSELDNYFVIFTDEANGYTLRCDFYTAVGDYLPSGEYTLGEAADGALSKRYTTFMATPSSQMTLFERGSVTVEATPNEETREVNYSFNGVLYFDNGDFVSLSYSGTVEGIVLPEPLPDTPNIPEGATVFTPDVETKQPLRYHNSSTLEPGEYYIKFYDSNWNELVLDLKLDPATCNDGKDALPAGSYTMVAGAYDSYGYVTMYNPYFTGDFTEAELVVNVDGSEYELTFIGTAGSGSTAKTFYMYYKGEIQDMVL